MSADTTNAGLDDVRLLHMHLEAVWHISLAPITGSDSVVYADSKQPDWRLYSAQMRSSQQINVWRANVSQVERTELLELHAHTPADVTTEKIQHEVALVQEASPTLNLARAQQIARPLTHADYDSLKTYDPDSVGYFLQPACAPLFGVVVNKQIRSIAHSSRRTAQACELGVETHPEARQRGYALAATILWAAAVSNEGLEPIYSALANNQASLNLAHAAGYRWFVRGTHYR